MQKPILNDLTTLQDELSAISSINTNNTTIENAFEKTLSRDGSSPNAMEADLDMNSNHILNLPAASDPTSPVRKAEFDLITAPDLPDTIFNAIAALNVPSSLSGAAKKILRVRDNQTGYDFAHLPVISVASVAEAKAFSAVGFDLDYLVEIEGNRDPFVVRSGSAASNGYTVTNDAVLFQNNAATLTFIRAKLFHQNEIEFDWWNTPSNVDCSTNLQAALNVAETFGNGNRQCTVYTRGSYTISNTVNLPNHVTLDGAGSGFFTVGAAMSLTADVFAEKSTETSNTRNAVNIFVRGITIDGNNRNYPEWLTTSAGVPITDPQADYTSPGVLLPVYGGNINNVVAANRRNAAATTTNGYLIRIENCNRAIIENCRFLNHGSFGVGVIGTINSIVRNNVFTNIGRISFQSPAIICSDFGSAWIVTNITKANPAVITVAVDTTLTNGSTVRLRNNTWGSFGATFTASTVSGTSITTNVDSSAFAGNFLFNGRQLLTTNSYIPSLNNIVENNQFLSLDRIAIQVGGENNIVRGNTIRDSREGGIFAFRALGAMIIDNHIENVTLSDIVANGIEMNYCTDCEVRGNRITRTVGSGISVIGSWFNDIDGNRIHSSSVSGSSVTYPYGPFSERFAFNIGQPIIAGTTVTSFDRTPITFSSINSLPATGNIRNNVISDDRVTAPTTNAMFFSRSGTAGNNSVHSLNVCGNDLTRYGSTINRANMIDWTASVINPQNVYIYDNKRTVTESPVFSVDASYAASTSGVQTVNCGFPARAVRVTAWDNSDPSYPSCYSVVTMHKTFEAQTDTGVPIVFHAWDGVSFNLGANTSNTHLIRLTDAAGTATVVATFSAWTEKGIQLNFSTSTLACYVRFEFYP